MDLRTLLSSVAEAIRARDGTTGKIAALSFPDRIRAVPTGSDILLKSLKITKAPSKTAYAKGNTFQPAGMTFQATVGDSSKSYAISVPLADVSFTPGGALAAGTSSVTASFRFGSQGVSAKQAITTSGTPSGEAEKPVAATELFSSIARAIRDMDRTSAGISAANFPARIRAIPKGSDILLKSLKILTPPSRTAYTCSGVTAESFSSAGMSLSATVGDGKKSYAFTVAPGNVSFSPSGALPAGTSSVTATFSLGKQKVSAKQAVTVKRIAVTWALLEGACRTWSAFEAKVSTWSALEA